MRLNYTIGACVLLAVSLGGLGCSPPERQPYKMSELLVQYETAKYDAIVSGAASLAVAPPDRQRFLDMAAYREREGIKVADYALTLGILDGPADGTDSILVREHITLWEENHDIRTYSYAEEIHRLRILNGGVSEDVYIGEDAPEFERARQLQEYQILSLRDLKGSPYAESFDGPDVEASNQSFLSASGLRSYALRHCNNPNPAYPYYGNTSIAGGDCTNFASQCLEAGALPFVDNSASAHRYDWAQFWWSNTRNRSDHSQSWSSVSGLKRHFEQRSGAQSVHWVWEQAHVGDVVFMDFEADGVWNHACVVTTAERRWWGGFDLRVSCHTNNRCDYDFYQLAGNNGWWIQIIHMP